MKKLLVFALVAWSRLAFAEPLLPQQSPLTLEQLNQFLGISSWKVVAPEGTSRVFLTFGFSKDGHPVGVEYGEYFEKENLDFPRPGNEVVVAVRRSDDFKSFEVSASKPLMKAVRDGVDLPVQKGFGAHYKLAACDGLEAAPGLECSNDPKMEGDKLVLFRTRYFDKDKKEIGQFTIRVEFKKEK